jgi:hypothetical protein
LARITSRTLDSKASKAFLGTSEASITLKIRSLRALSHTILVELVVKDRNLRTCGDTLGSIINLEQGHWTFRNTFIVDRVAVIEIWAIKATSRKG